MLSNLLQLVASENTYLTHCITHNLDRILAFVDSLPPENPKIRAQMACIRLMLAILPHYSVLDLPEGFLKPITESPQLLEEIRAYLKRQSLFGNEGLAYDNHQTLLRCDLFKQQC